MSNNGHEEERVKKCPFSGNWCEKEECVLWSELQRNMGGLVSKVGMCSLLATNMLLSEMNMQLSQQHRQPLPKIQLPGMRG